jgi:hypothetical protein
MSFSAKKGTAAGPVYFGPLRINRHLKVRLSFAKAAAKVCSFPRELCEQEVARTLAEGADL